MMSLLFGCSNGQQGNSYQQSSVENDELVEGSGFTLRIPRALSNRLVRDDGSMVIATRKGPASKDRPGDYYLSIYPPQLSNCSLASLGITHPMGERRTGTALIVWGRVQLPKFGADAPDAAWRAECWTQDLLNDRPQFTDDDPYAAAYALCAQRQDGRTFFFCIRQVTPDSNLAQKIFDTFRWTK